MKISIQLLCFLTSFIFGFLINIIVKFHKKKLKNATNISKFLISFLVSYICVITYVDIIYFINNGNFHIYFIIFIILGIIFSYNIKSIVKFLFKNR